MPLVLLCWCLTTLLPRRLLCKGSPKTQSWKDDVNRGSVEPEHYILSGMMAAEWLWGLGAYLWHIYITFEAMLRVYKINLLIAERHSEGGTSLKPRGVCFIMCIFKPWTEHNAQATQSCVVLFFKWVPFCFHYGWSSSSNSHSYSLEFGSHCHKWG